MGYRLHAHKHYAPQFIGGCFNHDYENWSILFADKFSENGWQNEDETECEVYRPDLENYVKHLKTLQPNRKNHYFPDYTNIAVASELEELLQSEDEYIRMEWF